jgi:hypothetical protein
MSNYFSYFPTTAHDLKGDGKTVYLQNILRRFKIRSSVKNKVGTFHKYDIQAGDRPDTIANKFYGNSKWAWVVLHYNDIQDPIWEWPMFDPMFNDYVSQKYGSIASAQSTVHEYRWIYQPKEITFDGIVTEEKYHVIDLTKYNTLAPAERKSVTQYDYEVEINDAKRSINLLDPKFLPQLESEVKTIIRSGI